MKIRELLGRLIPEHTTDSRIEDTNRIRRVESVIFEDDFNLLRIYRHRLTIPPNLILDEANTFESALRIIQRVTDIEILPNLAIVDLNLRASRISPDDEKRRIREESLTSERNLYSGHYICYMLRRYRERTRLPLRIIGVSANEYRSSDDRFLPDVSFVKPLFGDKMEQFLVEVQNSAT